MSAIYMDSFDQYGTQTLGTGNMLDGAWAQVAGDASGLAGPGVPVWGSRTGLYSLRAGNNGLPYRYVLPVAKTNMFQSFGFSLDGLPTGNFVQIICSFCTSGNSIFARLWAQADGSIALTSGANTTILAQTQGPILTSRTWHFLEMNMNATGNAFTLRVDDATASNTPAIDASGLGFSSPTVGQIQYLTIAGGGTVPTWMDDLFIRDTSGTVNNSWLGDRRIAALFVNADTPTSGWTPSYYHCFGDGILRMGYMIPNTTSPQNPNAAVFTAGAAALDVTNDDFTLESMIRFDALPTGSDYASIFSQWDVFANKRSFRLILGSTAINHGSLQFDTSTDGTAATIASPIVYPWTPVLNTWYSIAIVRSSGELLLFVDGEQFGLPIADSSTYYSGTEAMSVGCEYNFGPVNGTTLTGENGRVSASRMVWLRYTLVLTRCRRLHSPLVVVMLIGLLWSG